MSLLKGIQYNFKGFLMGVKTPKLLILGFLRFFIVFFLAIALSGLILFFHTALMNAVWKMPESGFLLYLWNIVSWLMTGLLALLSSLLAYFIAQLLFCLFIMDYMSRKVENMITGKEIYPENTSFTALFIYLVKQEIPRTLIPVFITVFVLLIGLLTPFGSVIAVVSSIVAVTFLAWDNTDLVPARRMYSFKQRFQIFLKNIMFNIGFGLLFLIPFFNILFLSFAPVGATLFYIENIDKTDK